MNGELEYKAVTTSPRATSTSSSEDGVVEALVAITGVPDNVGDVIMPGAFAETLAARKPKGVFSHDTTTWVARTEVVEEWLPGDPRLPRTTKDGKPWPSGAGALYVKARFNLKSDDGRNAYENVRFFSETDECEWSIGYRVPKGGAHRGRDGIRYIKKLDLYEYSPVLFGAASQSMTLSVKAGVPGVADTPSDRAAVQRLRNWFVRGEGAARIRWGQPGDFERCVRLASRHMSPENARGWCNLRHQDALGVPPGQEHKDDGLEPFEDEDLGNLLTKAAPAPDNAEDDAEDPAADDAEDDAADGGRAPDRAPGWGSLTFRGRVTRRTKRATKPATPATPAAAGKPVQRKGGKRSKGGWGSLTADARTKLGTRQAVAWGSLSHEHADEKRPAVTETKGDLRIELLRANGVPIPLSYEEIRHKLWRALCDHFHGDGKPLSVEVEATYPEAALVRVFDHHSGTRRAYQIPYTISGAGAVTLGDPVEIAPPAQEPSRTEHEARAALEELLEAKADGQVLTGRTARKLRSAVETLVSLLRDIGIEVGGIEPPDYAKAGEAEPLPPEPAVMPDSTAPSALPNELKTLTRADLEAGLALVREVGLHRD